MNSYSTFNQPHFRRPAAGAQAEVSLRPATRVVSSDSLFRGSYEIGIEHHGAMYRLKITRQGKLILNK
ncbi:hemin uptake protein HemP [Aquamicrobium sp. LC103]|uniref:hemin uptake protein HemP n=1 Tax=Aquamicrobium sp. LC103 TaxID=1120658 RepID=UPI00063ECAD3|nr:hemin uptake protein HemP [Aquamicrobium sp. LC103]TKT79130.1 hemin uptake protein HemP [Aquamicrobium sp. LC103]